MWQRKSFHDCANELSGISDDFRSAHLKKLNVGEERRNQILIDTSNRGVEILRTLALAIRSEQDYGIIPAVATTVGAIKPSASEADIVMAPQHYRPPYHKCDGYDPLALREALNKVAHADPAQAGFFADEDVHDLILCGTNRRKTWVAIVSIVDLCAVIRRLPDVPISKHVNRE